MQSSSKSSLQLYKMFLVVGAFLVIFAHLWKLGALPVGIQPVESSIGYNVLSLLENGRSENGVLLPIIFKTIYNYSGPFIPYLASLFFFVFGPSIVTLRLASAIMFLVFVCSLTFLLAKILNVKRNSNNTTQCYPLIFLILAAGFLPWTFPLSRVTFDDIAVLPLIGLSLFFLYKTYHQEYTGVVSALIAGALLGFSIYASTTTKIVPFLSIPIIGIFYFRKETLLKSTGFIAAFVVVIIPYFIYSTLYPDLLLFPISSDSYLFDANLSFLEKIWLFLSLFFRHVSFDFLVWEGDADRIRHIGYGGELFITVFLLFLVEVSALLFSPKMKPRHPFHVFLFVLFIISVIPAALFQSKAPHAGRSILMCISILLLAGMGFGYILDHTKKQYQHLLAVFVVGTLALEISLYSFQYFSSYPEQSNRTIGNGGFISALQDAIDAQPLNRVLVLPHWSTSWDYHNYYFLKRVLPNPNHVTINHADIFEDAAQANFLHNTCFVLADSENESWTQWIQTLDEPLPEKTHEQSFENAHVFCY